MLDVRRRYANVPARTKNTIARTNVSPARRFRDLPDDVRGGEEGEGTAPNRDEGVPLGGFDHQPPRRIERALKSPFSKVSDLSTSPVLDAIFAGFRGGTIAAPVLTPTPGFCVPPSSPSVRLAERVRSRGRIASRRPSRRRRGKTARQGSGEP